MWMKVDEARRHAGGVSRQILYAAVRTGKLRAARVGHGRNLVFNAEWIDSWLRESSALTDMSVDRRSQGGAA